METPLKCYAYARVSGLAQMSGDGIERQKIAIQEYAERNGFVVDRWFIEEGISGTKDLDERPALYDMNLALSEGTVNTVIFEKLDRLARDLLICETIIGEMMRKGYHLISTMEPDLCSNEPSRVLIRQIFASLAQYDRATLVLKMKVAKDRIRAKEGRCEGRLPFGRHPGEDTTLAKMKSLDAEGLTFQAIADQLNSEGTLTRYGKPWRASSVHRILAR